MKIITVAILEIMNTVRTMMNYMIMLNLIIAIKIDIIKMMIISKKMKNMKMISIG